MADTQPDDEIYWSEDGAPRSQKYDDVFFSRVDGLAESRHVFQDGVGLSERLAAGGALRIGEIGFGVGLNFLAAWGALEESRQHAAAAPVTIDYVGFERAPPPEADVRRALAPWPDLTARRDQLLTHWPLRGAVELTPDLSLTILVGEAIERIDDLPTPRDVWWLDGFSPAKNPEAWDPALLTKIFERTAPGGRLATYAAAGWVRRGLIDAGFEVSRAPGFGAKREMLTAKRPG